MKKEIVRRFIRLGRAERPMTEGERIELVPRAYYGRDTRIGFSQCLVFDVVERARGAIAGELAIRVGDSEPQFYFGHIGYHIDPPYRGRHYALDACRLALPVLRALGMRTVIITTDPDNAPSIATCERLGCVYECTVDVPESYQRRLELSPVKRRYVLEL